MPFGYWGLNGHWSAQALAALGDRLHLRVWQCATRFPEVALETYFPAARAAGVPMTLRLTGGHSQVSEGPDFSLQRWRERLVVWKDVLGPYVEDGTLVGHMLLDDIANFEGRDATAADLEEMARTSKALFPGLMCFVRERATALPVPAGGRYEHVDACVNQYKHLDGPVEAWAEATAARAEELGLGVISGLNLCDGGDGRSGQPGWREGRWAMSGEEILAYGRVMAAVPGVRMFLCWEYDSLEDWADGSKGSDWLDRPAQAEALAELGALVSAL